GNPAGLFRAAWSLAFLLPALIISLSFHELAHAWTASKLGDDTAARQGRLTIDPRAHLDPLGTFMLILTVILGFGIGWAKPVPVNPWKLRIGPRAGMAVVAIAGPIANLLIAFVALQLLRPLDGAGTPNEFLSMIGKLASLNIVLAVFNMLPIPPLDGYRVLLGVLPGPAANSFASIEPYGPMILLMVIFIGRGLLFGIINLVGGPLLHALSVPILGVLGA
ncbi:MAG TPA: site-2 protease family protein, partial [Chloroflexota bacterium]